ncbi:glycoside hydrolase family 20 protein [Dysgonomonas massiliensis]|uniref:glycoside hydrolase family 20 protein n=1 Tax=Dysgonomonas massiliensis TaxID=2040292 RepID=UPI000C75AD5D|nr:family 20 glycosylhydrolase [Dysgonomonas massiliensis]
MKYKYKYLFVLSFIFFLISCGQTKKVDATYNIVPKIQKIELRNAESFVLNNTTKIVHSAENKKTADLLAEYIKLNTGITVSVTDQKIDQNSIILKNENVSDNPEAYKIAVTKDQIIIDGTSEAGVFYGVQTLRKAIPAGKNIGSVEFKAVSIEDFPRFSYRGMHMDVARHMFSIDSIKIYIDMLAMHNINRFHWHLTDDQGWRLEIKKYPELTKIGSMREQTVIGKNSGVYDGQPYGGYYTQEEVKEIIQYAKDRFITVIPEVDLPGHMLAALTTYPNLGCTGGPYKVAQTWGVFDDVLCAGNDDIYPFLEDIFDEVIELFPSEYIHIGGDECPKAHWEKCPKCQAKIKELGLKADKSHTAEQRLQSYVIQRIEKYINDKGRKIIGWDEILEGGIAPNATIMSWRGTEGGLIAAQQGHDAIMTPTSFMYFDYYQSANLNDEYFGIGGFVPVEKVYSYEPVAEELPLDKQKHILGVQANLWSEYIKSFKQAQHMVLPRMAALCEVQWTMPDKKDYADFLPRLANLTKLYDYYGYNYATYIFDITADYAFNSESKDATLTLSTFDNAPIYYTTDGSVPSSSSTLYESPIQINKTTNIKAIALRDNGYSNSRIYEKNIDLNKATFKPITLDPQPWKNHAYGGAPVLVDGELGSGVYSDGTWIGYDSDVTATIDLEEAQLVSKITLGTFIDPASWIFNLEELIVETSMDNKNFTQVFSQKYPPVADGIHVGPSSVEAKFDETKAKFVKITAKRISAQPEWAAGPKHTGHLFIDEIKID